MGNSAIAVNFQEDINFLFKFSLGSAALAQLGGSLDAGDALRVTIVINLFIIRVVVRENLFLGKSIDQRINYIDICFRKIITT